MLSDNQNSENVPQLTPSFEYIHKKFVEHYEQTYRDHKTQYELKPIKKHRADDEL